MRRPKSTLYSRAVFAGTCIFIDSHKRRKQGFWLTFVRISDFALPYSAKKFLVRVCIVLLNDFQRIATEEYFLLAENTLQLAHHWH